MTGGTLSRPSWNIFNAVDYRDLEALPPHLFHPLRLQQRRIHGEMMD